MKKIVLYLMIVSTLVFANTLSLKEGWNLVGVKSSLSLDELKRQIGIENLLIVQGEEKTYQKKYVDSNQSMLNDFEAFEKGKSYWVKVASNSSVEYSKIEYETEQNLTLKSGWNLINPYNDLNLSSIIAQLGVENVEVIQGEDKTYQKAYVDSNQLMLNDFEKFEEPKGYWIKVKNAGVLSFSFVNNAPSIVGTANRVVYLYEKYTFTPITHDIDGDALIFSIENKPAWAEFNSTTGMLGGYPARSDIGTFSNIKISVSDEEESVISLEPFSIEVKEARNIAQLFGKATQPPKNGYYYYKEPSRAIDGDLSTYNHTQCSSPNNWLQIELPNATKVHKIVLNNLSGQQARLNGSTVYLSNSSYTGSEELNSAEALGTLNLNMIQTIELSVLEENHYLLIKGNPEGTNSCLHLTEVEVYGELTKIPMLTEHEHEFLIQGTSAIGTTVTTLEAIDYQGDTLLYTIDNPAFMVDNQGNIKINTALQAGTYPLVVSVSDGVNTITTNLTVNVTSATAVEDALSSGSVLNVTEEELIQATRDEIENLRIGESLLQTLYKNESITYDPTNRSQLINIIGDVHKIFPILQGNKGETLAAAGTKEKSRFAAFGAAPMQQFQAGNNLTFEPQFKRLLVWLMGGEPLDMSLTTASKTVALSFASNDRNDIKNWFGANYANWSILECNDATTLATCYNNVDLIITGWQTDEANTQMIRETLEGVVNQGTPVLYLHTWYEAYNSVAHSIADLFEFSLPYGGNYWAKDTVNIESVEAMQLAVFNGLGYASIDTMLAHFQAKDYDFDWSQCKDGSSVGSQYDDCSDVVGLDSDFQEGATKVRTLMTGLDSSKKDIFATSDYRLQKLLALIGDKFRESVSYPMDKVTSDNNEFMQSYYSDHAVYNYRKVNPAQNDMGNFSRSDFSHIAPTTKTVNLTSKKNFRSTGAYALPGQTVKVTRNDSSDLTVKVFINTLRSGATHQYQPDAYNRPKYLQTPHFEIASGESIELTSPYGGTLQLEFDTNDLPVEITFENVGEHAYWASSADDASFTQKLDAGDFDWAEVVTTGFEVHSKLDKMQESVADEKWGTAEALAVATKQYMSNYPHILAGFKGPGIDEVAEIHDFAIENNLTIYNLDLVKHMNADQATCGYGCSGNPYDAYWAFSPIGHGDVHELGHGLEKSRFQFEGFELHAVTNPYSYYTKSKYNENTGGDPDCQELPFKEVFEKLQASVNEVNATAYLQTNLWKTSSWSQQVLVTIQAMMQTQKMEKLENGWHLLARLHILERDIDWAKADWDVRKASIGFDSYTLAEFNAMRKNDWLLVSFSFASGLDFRDYLTMMGIEYSQKASAQVASFDYKSVPKIFFVSTPDGYCKSDDTYGAFLDKSTLEVDGTTPFPY